MRVAVSRVEQELAVVDRDAQALEPDGYAADDRRQRGGGDHAGGVGVDVDPHARDDGAQVEGAGDGGDRYREAVGRAAVGACQVDRPGEGIRFGAGADVDGSRCRSCCSTGRRPAVRAVRGTEEPSGSCADEAGRQHGPQLREVLLPVGAMQVERVGGVGARRWLEVFCVLCASENGRGEGQPVVANGVTCSCDGRWCPCRA
jgi:hypothetical protein